MLSRTGPLVTYSFVFCVSAFFARPNDLGHGAAKLLLR